ncbi:MAG: cysteine hydrolase [Deltaproteobacteria bacterium]|nr:cysteine hydrolase [Deltaproteobacteria bacterium]
MSEALVIIDIQKDYFPGGRMEVVNSADAAQAAKSLLGVFRKNNKNIVHVRHVSTREGATFFLPETEGVEIHESVTPLNGEKIITKHFPNSFRDTDLADYLHDNGVEKIYFCGMMSHMCIDATVRAAFDQGFTCIIADDACATRNLSHGGIDVTSSNVHASYMAALGAVYADIMNSKEIIEQIDT